MNNISPSQILNAMLLGLNDPKYLNYFPYPLQNHFAELGRTAVLNQDSTIRTLLEGLAHAVYSEQVKEIL